MTSPGLFKNNPSPEVNKIIASLQNDAVTAEDCKRIIDTNCSSPEIQDAVCKGLAASLDVLNSRRENLVAAMKFAIKTAITGGGKVDSDDLSVLCEHVGENEDKAGLAQTSYNDFLSIRAQLQEVHKKMEVGFMGLVVLGEKMKETDELTHRAN